MWDNRVEETKQTNLITRSQLLLLLLFTLTFLDFFLDFFDFSLTLTNPSPAPLFFLLFRLIPWSPPLLYLLLLLFFISFISKTPVERNDIIQTSLERSSQFHQPTYCFQLSLSTTLEHAFASVFLKLEFQEHDLVSVRLFKT